MYSSREDAELYAYPAEEVKMEGVSAQNPNRPQELLMQTHDL
jgi:hypothetical protein